MKLPVTKMHGAGNDFVVIDGTRGVPELTRAQWRWLADRHVGVGADQILIVARPTAEQQAAAGPAGLDFVYRIINADGIEVEQCGNGARCFVRFVHEQGLTDRARIRVLTRGGIIAPRLLADGMVEVDMGPPAFEPAALPFDGTGLTPVMQGQALRWPLRLGETVSGEAAGPVPAATTAEVATEGAAAGAPTRTRPACGQGVQAPSAVGAASTATGLLGVTREVVLVSMGNPHAVQVVADVQTAPVRVEGPLIEQHPRFPARVNAGFMQVLDAHEIALRVYERGAGETLACGTGACAAVVAGMQQGLLVSPVRVGVPGGTLTISWQGPGTSVFLNGPAQTVFSTVVDVPDDPRPGLVR